MMESIDPVIDLVGGVDDVARNVGARIVDQHIEASEPLENFLDGLVHGRGVAHVHSVGGTVRPGLPKCFGLRLGLLAVEIDDRDPITVGGESLGGGETDPLRRSGDYDNALILAHRPAPATACSRSRRCSGIVIHMMNPQMALPTAPTTSGTPMLWMLFQIIVGWSSL